MKRSKNGNHKIVVHKGRDLMQVSSKQKEEEVHKSMRTSKTYSSTTSSQVLEPTIDTASLSSEAHNVYNRMDDIVDSSSDDDNNSEISSVSYRSHESRLSFIRGKALYNLAQEMNALVDEMQDLDMHANQKEGNYMNISGSVSDDSLDNLQRELQNADEAFGDMCFDWDGKSIVVVQSESKEGGITDIPNTTSQQPQHQKLESTHDDVANHHHHYHHATLISLDESTKQASQDKATKSRLKSMQDSKIKREESNDFPPQAPSKQEHHEMLHLAPKTTMSWKESTQGLHEEESSSYRSGLQSKPAFRQLEEILAILQEENRMLRTKMDQIQQIRTKEEEEYDRNMQEVEEKMLNLMERLKNKQDQYNDAMKQARDERASLEQDIQTKHVQIQQLELHYQQQSLQETSRRKKLEKALNTVQRDLERVDSVTSDMVQELDDASSYMGNNSISSHRSSLNRGGDFDDGWSATASPIIAAKTSRRSFSDRIPEALTINHVLHMCQQSSPNKKVSNKRRSSLSLDPPPDSMVDEIKLRNEKAVQVLVELKTKAAAEAEEMMTNAVRTNNNNNSSSIALDYYGPAAASLLDTSLVQSDFLDENNNHMGRVLSQSSFVDQEAEEESDLLTKQLSVQRDIIARLETKQKTMMENSRQRYSIYESELSELKGIYDEQLATFANENESLNQKLEHVTTTIENMKSRHQQEISSLKLERQEIENSLLMDDDESVSSANFDKFRQENESLSRQLVQYNEALEKLRSVHESEIKTHEANQTSLVLELKKLQSKYENSVGSFHRQKEILMKKLIEKERAISEIELAQESTLKARQEEKKRLEKQLQTLDERCVQMKKERSELLQAQKKKLESFSLHLKDLKTVREMEQKAADKRISELEEKLETLHPSDPTVTVAASDTTGSLDPPMMADEDAKMVQQDNTIGAIADQDLENKESYVGLRGTMALLLVILLIACIQLVQVHVEEKNSLIRELALLRGEVHEWKMRDAAKDVTNSELQDSLEQTNSKSLSHKEEALALADQLYKLQAKYESLQQEHADHLESYHTSHEPLQQCFHIPALAMVASFEERLKDMVQQKNDNAEAEVLAVGDTPLDQDVPCEEDRSIILEESTLQVSKTRSVGLVSSQATAFELSKAGLEAEFFLVSRLERQDGFLKDTILRFRGQVKSTATKLKNRLLPEHQRLITSEEGVWLDL